MSLGVALQVGAANWDIIWHGIVNVESFFTPPHTLLYSGVGLSLVTTIVGMGFSIKKVRPRKSPIYVLGKLPIPLKIIALGCIIEIFSGLFDNWWHTNFGFDGLLSPPHLMLISGMLLSILGALIGTHFSEVKKFKVISEMVCYSILWMILINFVFMFTLPFSEGQYFNFNPSPTTALILGSTLPAIFTAIIFYYVQDLSFPLRMTVVAAILMTLQGSATIISNSYFAGLLPLYFLNILIPLSLDLVSIYTRQNNKLFVIHSSEDFKRIVYSISISFFFITLFFPWSVNMFKSFFGIDLVTFESVVIFERLLWKFIVPVLMPISFISAYIGILAWKELLRHSKLTNMFRIVLD